MIEPIRRWSEKGDLKEDEVLAFLRANEPRIDQKKNKELLRILGWALPLYAKMEVREKVQEALSRFICRHDQEAFDRAHEDSGYF